MAHPSELISRGFSTQHDQKSLNTSILDGFSEEFFCHIDPITTYSYVIMRIISIMLLPWQDI